ncbi:acyl carrier protein [Paenibacillus hexagrammi]|uniref:Acyl carrier protein n=1 Tax=Paenibacillus hexagrammi TaxID=2908839 RepID=A0ABY3SCZ3_9BACL|nr:acyl carrier protein [Paenibacillus sp. YPD9-1]UJF31867.1 acyl carrier protein [Paenibacillus sp. YPD9-1]
MDERSSIDFVLKRILLGNVRQNVQMYHIEEDTDLVNELALDSLFMVNLFVDLEEEFEIKIHAADLERPILKKYKFLKEYVMEKISHKH